MSLTHLNVHHVRNITTASLTLHPRFNLFLGANGSGKTSLLESIYLLGTGRSFCTREASALIQHGKQELTVFARTRTDETVSIQKSITSASQVKLNHQTCQRSSELARFLPCLDFYQDIFQIIDEGPAIRRSLLDWGLFHVKPAYHDLWKDYRRVVKQRNALLRQKASRQQFVPWNNLLVELSTQLDAMRSDYFQDWSSVFVTLLQQLTDTPCSVHYFKGWDKRATGKGLAAILDEQFSSDLHAQYTHSGAHQADILFETSEHKARQSLSRGQQKIFLIALKLAQASLLEKPCIYLFDDIAAELDAGHLQRFITCLNQIRGQFFLTAIQSDHLNPFLDPAEMTCFVIKDGCFT